MNNGFIYVATINKAFLIAARYSAQSLKEYWPESKITLFTIDGWPEENDYNIFDNIITKNVPNHKRTKLWALSRTPYKLTCYIDCDTFVSHEDVKLIFNQHNHENDITITRARTYAASIKSTFKGGKLEDHCGLFLYNNKKHTLEFMKQWWLLYVDQNSGLWNWNYELYPEYLRPWDMWTYWWLQNKTKYKIKRDYFPDPDARWNFVYCYKKEELNNQPVVITHQPIPRSIRNAKY
tara:strand:+ start:24561 stop:25268 length:708 start_codon:yes stop_codon:yes gene_type:complete